MKLKIKDAFIHKLKEQIVFRDDLIDEARRMLKSAGAGSELNDNRVIDVDDLLYDPFDKRDRSNPRETEQSSRLRNYNQSRVSQ